MAKQSELGWSIHEAFVKAYKVFDSRVNETYTWIEEALAEAKKTMETAEVQLIPKTPSAKRLRKKEPTAHGRSLRSTQNRESHDSGIDFAYPRRTRNRNTSRLDGDESVSQLDFIKESVTLGEIDERLELSANKMQNPTGVQDMKARKAKRTKADNTVIEEQVVLQTCDIGSHPEKRAVQESVLESKSELEDSLKSTQTVSKQMEAERDKKCQEDAMQVLSEPDKENILPLRSSLNGQKLNEEFKLKACSVKLVQGNASLQPAEAVDIPLLAVNPNQVSRSHTNLFPSPHSQNFVSPTNSSVNSTSAGGRLLNMMKSAVGALIPSVIRRTGSPSTANHGGVLSTNHTPNGTANLDSTPVNHSTPETETLPPTRRSSSTHYGGPKLSLSKQHSSAVGYKSRLAEARKSRSSSGKLRVSSSTVVELSQPPVITNAVDNEGMITDDEASGSDSDEEIKDTPPQRVTRSKMRQCPRTVVAVPAKKAPTEAVAGEVRVTRSKMRVKDKPQTVETDDDDTPTSMSSGFQAPTTPSTVIKSKPLGQKVQQMQKLLCQNPSFSLSTQKIVPASPAPSNSARRKSVKRANEDEQTNAGSPPKKQCIKPSFFSPEENGRRIHPGSAQTTKTVEVHSFLKKKPTTPVHNNISSMMTSFLQKTTPKILTREEILERKRKELEEKNKKMNEMTQKRNELMQRRVEEQRRLREEQHQQVLKRRQEMEVKKLTTSSSTTRLSVDNVPRMATRQTTDDRTKVDQQDRQKLREKRIAEAEQRRKQEEEVKKQMQLQQEREKQLQEEQARRRREQEEVERQQRIAEQRRLEDERRARVERERQLELERQRQLEEQRLKEELERQRAKEERERKERAEKERLELERLREKERQRQLEIERQKEMERIRLAEERARLEEERRIREEQVKTQKAVEKHNVLHKQTNNSGYAAVNKKELHVSLTNVAQAATVKPPTTATASKAQSETVLNRTFNKEPTSESYEMTPVAKKVYKSSTHDNYDINDLNSEDSTDEEDRPRKKIPSWAEGTALKVALINQHCHPPDLEKMFGKIEPPDLNLVFAKKRPRFNKRTSSAVWETSIVLPKSP